MKNSATATPRDLVAEWAHLRTWWAQHGTRYNLTTLAGAVGKSKAAVSSLLSPPESARRYKASAELLDKLITELGHHYTR